MDTQYLNTHDDLFIALLPEDQEYQVLVNNSDTLGWDVLRVDANYVETTDSGNLEFYQVDEDVLNFVAGFPPKWYGPYGVVFKEEVDQLQFDEAKNLIPEDIVSLDDLIDKLEESEPEKLTQPDLDEYEEALLHEGLSPEVASQLAALLGRVKAAAPEAAKDYSAPKTAEDWHQQRAKIRADLKQGVFPPDDLGDLRRPEKLKEVWEQQGDLDVDPLTGYSGEHAVGSPEREAEHEATLERLRAEADRDFVPADVEPWHGKSTTNL